MAILFHCEKCSAEVDEDNIGCVENNWCYECDLQRVQNEAHHLFAIYQAEKFAGLTRSREEIDADIRAAGRGHLLKG